MTISTFPLIYSLDSCIVQQCITKRDFAIFAEQKCISINEIVKNEIYQTSNKVNLKMKYKSLQKHSDK